MMILFSISALDKSAAFIDASLAKNARSQLQFLSRTGNNDPSYRRERTYLISVAENDFFGGGFATHDASPLPGFLFERDTAGCGLGFILDLGFTLGITTPPGECPALYPPWISAQS